MSTECLRNVYKCLRKGIEDVCVYHVSIMGLSCTYHVADYGCLSCTYQV